MLRLRLVLLNGLFMYSNAWAQGPAVQVEVLAKVR